MRGGNRASGQHMRWKGIPGNLVTHFFPVFSFNVAFGHQSSRDTWLPSRNGSHVRSEQLGTDQRASTLSFSVLCNFLSLSNPPPTLYRHVLFTLFCISSSSPHLVLRFQSPWAFALNFFLYASLSCASLPPCRWSEFTPITTISPSLNVRSGPRRRSVYVSMFCSSFHNTINYSATFSCAASSFLHNLSIYVSADLHMLFKTYAYVCLSIERRSLCHIFP